MISIIDYGMGNVGSISNMLKKIGAQSKIISDVDSINSAEKLILPGVGAFDNAIEEINTRKFSGPLEEAALERKIPILGICLGMQLLTRGSEEGVLPGFGWIAADTKRFSFPDTSSLRIPHMGWNTVNTTKQNHIIPLTENEQRFYFVHSFRVVCDNSENVIGTTDYGGQFHCAINRENIYGTQFHPEKSHRFGMELLTKFASV